MSTPRAAGDEEAQGLIVQGETEVVGEEGDATEEGAVGFDPKGSLQRGGRLDSRIGCELEPTDPPCCFGRFRAAQRYVAGPVLSSCGWPLDCLGSSPAARIFDTGSLVVDLCPDRTMRETGHVRWTEAEQISDLLGEQVVAIRTLTGGYSHQTSLLALSQRSVTVRTGTADHAIEAAVMAAVRGHVPVPAVIAVLPPTREQPCSSMVLDYVAGTPLDQILSDMSLDRKDFHLIGSEVGRVAAGIGAVRFERPGFFADSQLAVPPMPPWSQQLPSFADRCVSKIPEGRLDLSERNDWAELCATHAPALSAVDHHARLVHSDMNPKNLLITRTPTGWQVAAVLDWEFSYSGCPFADAANMMRFDRDYPPSFVHAFADAFSDHLPEDLDTPDFGYLGRVLDMFALSDLLTRPPGHPIADQAAEQVRQWLAQGVPTTL